MKDCIERKKLVFSTSVASLFIFLIQMLITPALMAVTLEDRLKDTPKEKTDTFYDNSNDRDIMKDREAANAPRDQDDSLAGKKAVVVPEKVPYKDPRLSCILSFIIPGMGEFYLRNDVKGVIFFLTTTTAYVLSFYYLYQGLLGSGGDPRNKLIIGGIGFVASLVLHIVGMVEAYNDAVEINEARYYMAE